MVHAYTLTSGTKVDANIIQKIISDVPMEAVLDQVWGKQISDWQWIQDMSAREAVIHLELFFRRHLQSLALDTFNTYKFHYGVILAYPILLESEVSDLITVMEGIHNSWQADNIMDSMIAGRAEL